MPKRIILFLLVNILIITTITIIANIIFAFLGINPYYFSYQYGINYQTLLIFCLVWGMGGAFISLALSRVMVKTMLKVKVIDPKQASGPALKLYQTVSALSKKAGLSKTPEVGIYPSSEVNAFATGPSKERSLVAVSQGLLERMNPSELEGVLGHEVAHIANGDMVTMTLIQGVINAFVMFFARILAYVITSNMRGDRGRSGTSFLLIIVFQIVFSILGSLVVAYFSRQREFRADGGSAQLAGKQKMIEALQALKQNANLIESKQESLATLKISDRPSKFLALLSTHPPLEERIKKLQQG